MMIDEKRIISDPYGSYIDSLYQRPKEVIKSELKDYVWFYDTIEKRLILYNKNSGDMFMLDRVRMFSLFRFLIRAAQKPLKRKSRKREIIL